MILPRVHVLLLNIGCIGCHVISSLSDVTYAGMRQNNVSFTQDGRHLKVKLDLLKRWHLKYARKRIQHAFEDRIDKSVPRVNIWHHSTEPRDAKQ